MGDTISSLVFRPPKPTPIHPSEYFYLDVDVHSPLCTSRSSRSNDHGLDDHGSCGGAMCLDTGESDLASLDANFIRNDSNAPPVCGSVYDATNNDEPPRPSGTVPNMRNGQMYKIPAFFIRRRGATQTILFSHGNAEDLGMMYGRMKDLAMVLGVNILAYDYTGYGLSIPGPAHGNCRGSSNYEGPSENMIYRNVEAAYRYLTVVRGIPPRQIILYGRSLGSGPSCYLAAKTALRGDSVGGLILHSPFLSVYKVVADLAGLDLGIVGDLFHNERRARDVRCPVLIIHGRRDEVVPFWHAPRLLAAVPPEFRAQPFYADGMGHNHIESRCRERYVGVVLNFLRMGVRNEQIALASALRDEIYAPSSPGKVAAGGGVGRGGGGPSSRGPSPVPPNERASPSETKENASFYVNKTWLRHAKVLLKEVFVDAGCYVNSVNDGVSESDNGSRRSQGLSASGRSAIGRSASGGGGRRESSSADHSSSDRYGGGGTGRGANIISDARDDEDEFAPWRGGGGRTRSITPPQPGQGYGETNNVAAGRGGGGGYHRQGTSSSHHHFSQSQKILTTRPSSPNDGSGGRFGGPPTPRYHKAQSLPVMSSPESDTRSRNTRQKGRMQVQLTKAARQGSFGRMKSMQVLEGLSQRGQQKRY